MDEELTQDYFTDFYVEPFLDRLWETIARGVQGCGHYAYKLRRCILNGIHQYCWLTKPVYPECHRLYKPRYLVRIIQGIYWVYHISQDNLEARYDPELSDNYSFCEALTSQNGPKPENVLCRRCADDGLEETDEDSDLYMSDSDPDLNPGDPCELYNSHW